MKISSIANQLNRLASQYKIGSLQELRRSLKGKNRVATYNIFDQKTLSDEEGWAFHFGGRSEMQFNVGLEDETGYFRFGLAFSLEPSRSLKDPVEALSEKITRANEYISSHLSELASYQMWYYQDGKRSRDMAMQAIPDRLVKNHTFIFIGKKLPNRLENVSERDLHTALQTMDQLLPLYSFVEGASKEHRVARVCWNTYRWQKPSGWEDKSKNPDAYESNSGYGHEEWILDTSRIIGGYHYGFVQCFNSRSDFSGRKMDLSLYTINGKTKARYWIGTIRNLEVIAEDQAQTIHRTYKRLGWLREMVAELEAVKINPRRFLDTPSHTFANIRFRPEELELLEKPLRFTSDDPAVPATYYSTLLNYVGLPEPVQIQVSPFAFVPGHNPMVENSEFEYAAKKGERDLFHNKMQSSIFLQLSKTFGSKNVGTEQICGTASRIDIVVKKGNSYDFYELKSSNSIRACIREALPQLLEYAFWHPIESMGRLIIVSQNKITNEAAAYLKILRTRFKLPLYYQWYDNGSTELKDELY